MYICKQNSVLLAGRYIVRMFKSYYIEGAVALLLRRLKRVKKKERERESERVFPVCASVMIKFLFNPLMHVCSTNPPHIPPAVRPPSRPDRRTLHSLYLYFFSTLLHGNVLIANLKQHFQFGIANYENIAQVLNCTHEQVHYLHVVKNYFISN